MKHNYSLEIRNKQNGKELLHFIKQIACRATKDDLITTAKENLRNLTRREFEEEPFGLFLDRLECVTDQITTDKAVRNYLIEDRFNDQISPENRQFLLDKDKSDDSVVSKAKFLDQRQKYKKNIPRQQIIK